MTTLKEILSMDFFSNLQLLNKKGNLEKSLDTVEITETPDVSNFISKNAFVLTTAMAFKNNSQGLCEFIRSLSNASAAGLGIKVGRFLPNVDPCVLDLANDLNFPIVQIPTENTLGDIAHRILGYLWDNQHEQFFYSQETQQELVNLMIHGASVDELIRQLGLMTKQTIFLIDSCGNISSASFLKSDKTMPKKQKKLLEKIRPYQTEQVTNNFSFSLEDVDQTIVNAYPIQSTVYFPYILVIFNVEKMPYPLSQLVIQQGITVLTLTLYNEHKARIKQKRERKELLNYLLHHDSNKNESEWLDYKKHFPILNATYYQVITIQNSQFGNSISNNPNLDAFIYDYLLNYTQNSKHDIALFPTENIDEFIFILYERIRLTEILVALHKDMYEQFNIWLRFGIGHSVATIELLHYSYDESRRCLEEETHKQSIMIESSENSFKSLLKDIPNKDIHYFCTSVLKGLAFPKNQSEYDLRNTLDVYLSRQCEITKTSEVLFVHRNTVKYRLKKCEELFNQSIHDPDFSLQLRIALYLSEEIN